jgi:hypothetical protein
LEISSLLHTFLIFWASTRFRNVCKRLKIFGCLWKVGLHPFSLWRSLVVFLTSV